MATRGKSTTTTALIPFECPQCDRHYRVELDFVKMRRLNRVAVCRGCDGRYTLSIRLERSAAPFDPDPYAAERLLADDERRRSANIRRLRDERPDRSSDPVLGETKVGNVYIMNTDPPGDSVVPSPSESPAPSAPPVASSRPADSEPATDSDPPGADAADREPDWPPGLEPASIRRERERRSRLDTAPSRRSPVRRQATTPDVPPFVVDDSPPPTESDPGPASDPGDAYLTDDAPLSDRRPRRSSSRYERTLDGVKRPDSSPPPSDNDAVDVRVIVEVGLVGDASKRKTTKNYRPEHLITLPGLGVPKGDKSDDKG